MPLTSLQVLLKVGNQYVAYNSFQCCWYLSDIEHAEEFLDLKGSAGGARLQDALTKYPKAKKVDNNYGYDD